MNNYRRDFIRKTSTVCVIFSLALAGALTGCNSTKNTGDVIVNTTCGKLKGTMIDGIGVFKGVSYAGPSDGINRFLPPTPVIPWQGIRDAKEFAFHSYQPFNPVYGKMEPMSENCQYLNIWSPSIKGKEKLPVMLWCHGGGFIDGTGSEKIFEGFEMAANGNVVVLNITHRLGPFGFLYLGHINEKYSQSGIVGLLDIVAALEWTRENISKFGGDPDNITLFGQSGGGGKVSTLMAMPSAKGLFHKAIVQSGPFLKGNSIEDAITNTNNFFKNLGLEPGDLETLLKLPPEKIIEGCSTTGNSSAMRIRFSPVVDGITLPSDPFDPLAPELSAGIPMIIGTNKDEFQVNLTDEKEIINAIQNVAGNKTDTLIAAYKEYYPDYSISDIYSIFSADARMRMNSIRVAERKIEQSAPVYMYIFNFGIVPEGGNIPRSAHSRELAFVFNHPELTPGGGVELTDDIVRLGNNMSLAWTSFAHNGNPSHQGIGEWPEYNAKERSTMIFDVECKVENDPGKKIREILTGL